MRSVSRVPLSRAMSSPPRARGGAVWRPTGPASRWPPASTSPASVAREPRASTPTSAQGNGSEVSPPARRCTTRRRTPVPGDAQSSTTRPPGVTRPRTRRSRPRVRRRFPRSRQPAALCASDLSRQRAEQVGAQDRRGSRGGRLNSFSRQVDAERSHTAARQLGRRPAGPTAEVDGRPSQCARRNRSPAVSACPSAQG